MTARRILFLFICIIIMLLLQTVDLYAQPGESGITDPDHPVPITGLEYLIGGGIAFGIRSLIKARKKTCD